MFFSAHATAEKPLYEKTISEILEQYQFVADFRLKPIVNNTKNGVFIKYPFIVPPAEFNLIEDYGLKAEDLPPAFGNTRAEEHLNRGRILMQEGKYDEARKTFLSTRARFGTTYPLHRTTDLFIGLGFYQLALQELRNAKYNWEAEGIAGIFNNVSTFFNWALIRKRDIEDKTVMLQYPKAMYVLAIIYLKFKRYAASYSTANEALNFLRITGRKDFRPELRRLLAEMYIKNRTYLKALRELDTSIQQDHDPEQALYAFTRVGDMYFDLNNFDLAEDAYALSQALSLRLDIPMPHTSILRGESLFWLGKYTESQKSLWFGLKQMHRSKKKLPYNSNFFLGLIYVLLMLI